MDLACGICSILPKFVFYTTRRKAGFGQFTASNVYFAGFDIELLERAGFLGKLLGKGERDSTVDTQFMDFVIELPSAH